MELGALKDGSIALGADTSDEIDLGAVFQDVILEMSADEAAQLGVAADTSLLAASQSGGTFNDVYLEDMSAPQAFAKPAAGGVRVTYTNVNARYIKAFCTVVTTALVEFTVRGVSKLEFVQAIERVTIP